MRAVSIALTLLPTAILHAQGTAPQRTLQSLLRENRAAVSKAAQGDDPGAYERAIAHFCKELRDYLQHHATGEEKPATRFQLVYALMSAGERKAAQKVLANFAPGTASAVNCGRAAYLASTFRMQKAYEAWVAIALRKQATFGDRMELGVLLMSKLRKPDLGKKLFADALKAAAGDEAKALVLWHQARATREREDVSDRAYDEALDKLAQAYPKTRYGTIAHDRLIAMDFRIGAAPLPLTVPTLSGGKFSLRAKRGHVALVCFWLPGDPSNEDLLPALQKLYQEYANAGLTVMGIALATEKDAAAASRQYKLTFDQAAVPGGLDADLALRYRVEDAPYCLLVGRQGKIRGMNFVLRDREGREHLFDAVKQTLEDKSK